MSLDEFVELFANPSLQYRPLEIIHSFSAPTNSYEELEELMGLGFGGVVCNVGLRNYLRNEKEWKVFLRGVRRAVELGLTVWLYDEEGYPSGSAGGLVLEGEPELESRGLFCLSQIAKRSRPAEFSLPVDGEMVCGFAFPVEERSIRVSGARPLSGLRWRPDSGEWLCAVFYTSPLFEGTHCTTNLYKARRYPNIIESRATEKFIALTHEEYRRRCGELWERVEAIFTDEPSLMAFFFDGSDKPAVVPWSEDLATCFERERGYPLFPSAISLFIETPESDRVKYDFYSLVSEMCRERYFGRIKRWCESAGIAFTGHTLGEETLTHHIAFEGNILSALRQMHIPGVDRLTVNVEELASSCSFVVEKLASSAGHHIGAEKIMSQTSDYIERQRGTHTSEVDIRAIAGFQFSLGINAVASYFDWRSGGEELRQFNEYCARLAVALRGGTHRADVAVYYPVEQVWSRHRSSGGPHPSVEKLQASFFEVSKWLLQNQIDFDYIDSEALDGADISPGRICLGGETYRVVVVPRTELLSSESAERLWYFGQDGRVLFFTPPRTDEKGRTLKGLFEFDSGNFALFRSEEALVRLIHQTVPADVVLFPPTSEVFVLHRSRNFGELYLLFNLSSEMWKGEVSFGEGIPSKLLQPETGKVELFRQPVELPARRALLFLVEK